MAEPEITDSTRTPATSGEVEKTMKLKKFSIFTTSIVVIGLLTVAVAVAALSPIGPISDTNGAPGEVALLKTTVNLTAAQADERAKLMAVVSPASTPSDSLSANADLSKAHPVTFTGSSAVAWVAPTSNGGVCTYIPDSEGGYGASCATLAELKAGDATTVTPRPDGSALVVALRPNGSGPVRVADGVGLPVRSNVAAGVIPADKPKIVDGHSFEQPGPPTGECEQPAKGEQFMRCSP